MFCLKSETTMKWLSPNSLGRQGSSWRRVIYSHVVSPGGRVHYSWCKDFGARLPRKRSGLCRILKNTRATDFRFRRLYAFIWCKFLSFSMSNFIHAGQTTRPLNIFFCFHVKRHLHGMFYSKNTYFYQISLLDKKISHFLPLVIRSGSHLKFKS